MMSPGKKKMIGFIAVATGLAVMVTGYFLFRPKQPAGPTNNGGDNNPGNGGGSGNASGNTSSSGTGPSPGTPASLKAGDKLIANESVNIYRDKVVSTASRIGYVPSNSVVGVFIMQEGDWMYVSKSALGNYPSGTPDYFYIYKSAKFTVIPY